MLESYIINRRTCAVISDFDKFGIECTLVFEGKEVFWVKQTPEQIVKTTFEYMGYSLNGAIRGARAILKKKHKVPVILSSSMGIVLIPAKVLNKTGDAWIVSKSIIDIEPVSKNKTKVFLYGGRTLIIDTNAQSFQEKRAQASFLYTTLLDRIEMMNQLPIYLNSNKQKMKVREINTEGYSLKKFEE